MRNTILIFLLLFSVRCTKNNENTIRHEEAVEISKINNIESIKFSEIGEELSVIKLDNNCMFGHIDRVVFHENSIYIFDREYAASVCKFNLEGSLQQRLFIEEDQKFDINGITDIFYDEQLVINDGATGNIFFLNNNLEVTKMNRLSFKGNTIYPFNGDWLIFNNGLQKELGYEVLIYDYNRDLISDKHIRINENDFGFHYDAKYAFNKLDDKVYFSKAFNDTVYTIDNQYHLIPKYVINFTNKVPKGYLSSGLNAIDLFTDMRNGKFSFLYGNIHFSKNKSIIMNFLDKGKIRNLVIHSNTEVGYASDDFEDDILSGATFQEIIYSDEKVLVFALSSEDLSDMSNINVDFKNNYAVSSDDNFFLFVLHKLR